MSKRRKRRSQKDITARVMQEIRTKRHAFLRDISQALSDTLGFKVRVSVDFRPDALPKGKEISSKVERSTSHLARWGSDQHAGKEEPGEPVERLASDDVPF